MDALHSVVVTTVEGVRPESDGARGDNSWADLYKAGAIAALVTAIVIPFQIAAFIVWPPPPYDAVKEWFTTFHDNPIIGLLSMDLLLMIDEVLLVAVVLALYMGLRHGNQTLMVAALGLFFVSIAAYFASNTAFQMLVLSNHYADATTATARAFYLGAGQAMMATYQGTAFIAYYYLGSVAGILIGLAMLRHAAFSNVAGWAAILGNGVGLALYVPVVGVFLSVLSGAVLWIWYFLVARDLWRLGRTAPNITTR